MADLSAENRSLGGDEIAWAREYEREKLRSWARFPRQGEHYRCRRDLKVDIQIHWRAPYSTGCEARLQAGDEFVVFVSAEEPLSVQAQVLRPAQFEARWIAQADRRQSRYDGYSLSLSTQQLNQDCECLGFPAMPAWSPREPSLETFQLSVLALACGDALCAGWEGGPLERLLWRLLGKNRRGHWRYTDDTQMSLDLIHSLVECGELDQDAIAQRFANSYRWSRGYGPQAAKLLRGIRRGGDWRQLNRQRYPEGSIGNGAAMRSAVIGLLYGDEDQVLTSKNQAAAEITHDHRFAIDGALLIACSVAFLSRGLPAEQLLPALIAGATHNIYLAALYRCRELEQQELLSPRELAHHLGNGITAPRSCVTALYLFLRFAQQDFAHLIAYIRELGGDTDTIAAMAAAQWGAYRGLKTADEALAPLPLEQLENVGLIREAADNLYALWQSKDRQ